MARVIGRPGYSAAREAVVGFAKPVGWAAAVVVVIGVMSPWLRGTIQWLAAALGVVIDAAVFRNDLREAASSARGARWWWQGAEGERRTAAELAHLPDDFIVFHDFRFKSDEEHWYKWNLDHIVIGPSGVFVVETKNYETRQVHHAAQDAFTAKNVKQVAHAAIDLKSRLMTWSGDALGGLWVEAVLVYTQEGAQVEKTREGSTSVIPLRLLLHDIQTRPKRDLDWESRFRVAQTLWWQLPDSERVAFAAAWEAVCADHKVDRQRHFDELDAREPASAPPADAAPTKCPVCGAALVRQTACKGSRNGKDFLGCTNWRSTGCKYVFNLDE